MVWKNGYAVQDAARANQLDRRQNGVIEYDQTQHSPSEGPLAVREGNSTSSVELRVRGGAANVGGQRVEHEPGPVGLEDGPPGSQWRSVLIYIAEDGSIQTQPGTPGENTLRVVREDYEPVSVVTETGETMDVLPADAIEEVNPEGPAAPVPEAYPADGQNGTILAEVKVPPGADSSADIPQNYIQDRRRPALKRATEGWEIPAHTTTYHTFEPGQSRLWPMIGRGGESLHFWGFSVSQIGRGAVTLANYDVNFELVDLESMSPYDDEGGVIHSWSQAPQGDPQSGPLETLDIPESTDQHGYAFRVRNDEASVTFTWPEDPIAIQFHWTLSPTNRY